MKRLMWSALVGMMVSCLALLAAPDFSMDRPGLTVLTHGQALAVMGGQTDCPGVVTALRINPTGCGSVDDDGEQQCPKRNNAFSTGESGPSKVDTNALCPLAKGFNFCGTYDASVEKCGDTPSVGIW